MAEKSAQLQLEVDTAFLYESLANIQEDASTAEVLRELAGIERSHVEHFLAKMRETKPDFQLPPPSLRARLQFKLGGIFGYDFIIANLSSVERHIAVSAIEEKRKHGEKPSGFEHNHLKILESLSHNSTANVSGGFLSKMEGRHKSVGGNALRAAVLGANDGLLSNMSLVMGVAGAAVANDTILLTGLAGLLAGAISMALGEWLSVQSSRELFMNQIALEAEELEASPEHEELELALIYQAKGMEKSKAQEMAHKIMSNKETALETLVREELGIDQAELGGSAWEAALTSFVLFAMGAIIPVIPFFFTSGSEAIYISLVLSVIGLFGIGSATSLFTGRTVWFSGIRQVLFGLVAAAVTYGVGHLIGVSIAG
ncbi:MAG: VIT1/CCC1 transporter family protein [Lewinellaceae bacterium]|nr:VIT1/CCC1 transporter family protein [Lewinellaceae bacterium]